MANLRAHHRAEVAHRNAVLAGAQLRRQTLPHPGVARAEVAVALCNTAHLVVGTATVVVVAVVAVCQTLLLRVEDALAPRVLEERLNKVLTDDALGRVGGRLKGLGGRLDHLCRHIRRVTDTHQLRELGQPLRCRLHIAQSHNAAHRRRCRGAHRHLERVAQAIQGLDL